MLALSLKSKSWDRLQAFRLSGGPYVVQATGPETRMEMAWAMIRKPPTPTCRKLRHAGYTCKQGRSCPKMHMTDSEVSLSH